MAEGREIAPTDRTRVRRLPDRARYQRSEIDAILDEGFGAHVGFAVDGRPWSMPTAYARVGDVLYLHGAAANHALSALAGGAEACVTVTLVDGLVLARSQFHHSVNYRSVMVFGRAERVDDPDEKARALEAVVEQVVPGRATDSRAPTPAELRATLVVRIPLDEASAKVRTGDPVDDAEDMGLGYWAGVIPLAQVARPPVPAADLDAEVAADPPPYATRYRRR